MKPISRSIPLILALGLTGCAALIEAPIRDKVASFQNIRMPADKTRELTAWLDENTSFAFSDASGMRVVGEPNGSGDYVVQIVGQNRPIGGGLAAAVSRDGYYLTASHVLGDDESVLLVRGENGKVLNERARVVWRAPGKRDLALLKGAPRRSCFALATRPPQPGVTVLAGGASGGDSAGVVFGMEGAFILHSAPLRRGDSGGPLINEHGVLVGVNRAIHVDPFNGRRNEAVLVDPDEIIALIVQDRGAVE